MKVKPNQAFRHANYPSNTAVSTEPQTCVLATNQPEWEAECKIFVESNNGAPEMLLTKDDYRVIVTEESEEGHYDRPYENKAVLLKVGQQLIPCKIIGDKMLCETLPKDDPAASEHQYAWNQYSTDVEIYLDDLALRPTSDLAPKGWRSVEA